MRGLKNGDNETARVIVDHFNAIVHADPSGSYRNLGTDKEGRTGFASGPNRNSPDACDNIRFQCSMYLVTLLTRTVQIFPEVRATNASAH
jgi:hypothetical protein